ncbi:MAG: NAD+ synthase [Cellvibrionaceae bacterium]
MSRLNIVMAQINPVVGDIDGNTQRVIKSIKQAQVDHAADVVIFPELTLCGYPPEDLLLRDSMQVRIKNALEILTSEKFTATVILGYPLQIDGQLFNMAGVLHKGSITEQYAKQELPNYQVFDEKRYFKKGTEMCVFDLAGIPTALTICEDIWHQGPMAQAKEQGAKLMINLNASPFHQQKQQQRVELLSQRALEGSMPVIYVNQVGGQDELVFDGGSFAVQSDGSCCVHAPLYEEGLYPLIVDNLSQPYIQPQALESEEPELQVLYDALVLGVRDYVNKNGFKKVILGLSGGIDSGLTLAIAVDALGAERVTAVMMPFTYTSELSRNDAQDQAQRLGVDYQVISIEPMYDAFINGLATAFEGKPVDLTEQNLQARCRGVILMAISNKTGALVLTTGNKSEMAVGYSTLYGDMAGGFDVLKDVPKTTVFALSRYRNTITEVIPPSVIERPPSAELAPDQKDEDNLPPYDVLDQILQRYIEEDQSADTIIDAGFDTDTVHRVIRLVDINEYKRRQAPIGVRISQRGFGRDRRYPITNGWKPGE